MNLLGLAILLGIAVAIYYVAMFSPVYLDNIDVTDAVASAFNQVGQLPDDRIVEQLKGKMLNIGTHRELNADGELVEARGLGLEDDAVSYERNPDNTVAIQVRYVREVRLKPTGRWVKVRFAPKKTGVPAGLK